MLDITAFVCVRNGMTKPHCLDKTLESLSFAEQLIVVNDASFDGSLGIAKKYTDEIYEWCGSDNMAERRNYAIGFKGNDRHTPEWISHPTMSKNHPVVRHDWIIYLDSDEFIYQHDMMPSLEKEFEKVFTDNEVEAYQLFIYNLTLKGEMMTSSPLMRIFKKGTVWWSGKMQHKIHHGNPVDSIQVAMVSP